MVKFHPFPIIDIIKKVFLALLISICIFIIYPEKYGYLAIVIIDGLLLLSIFSSIFFARFQTIVIDEDTLTYESGILSKSRVILPFAMITESSYNQTLIQRIFQVGDIFIDSAGGTKNAIVVRDIKSGELDLIVKKINKRSGKNVS